MTIRTTKIGNKTYYAAKDIIESLGQVWHSTRTIKDIVDAANIHTAEVKCSDGYKRSAIVVNKAGRTQVNTHFGVTEVAPTKAAKVVTKQDKKMEKLENQVKALKELFAKSVVTPTAKGIASGLTSKKTSGKVVKIDPLQRAAKVKIRELCEKYAEQRMTELGATTEEQKRMVYNLTYNALYQSYKEASVHKTDLKEVARLKSEKTGKRYTVLETAVQTGVAVELYTVAKALFAAK